MGHIWEKMRRRGENKKGTMTDKNPPGQLRNMEHRDKKEGKST